MAETQQIVASKDVKSGDTIQAFSLHSGGEPDRLLKVVDVRIIGVNVRIETDLGVTGILPVNRGIAVWR